MGHTKTALSHDITATKTPKSLAEFYTKNVQRRLLILQRNHLEFRTTINLIGGILIRFFKFADKFFGERITLLELRIQSRDALSHSLWGRLAITLRTQATCIGTCGEKIINHLLGTSVAQFQIKLITTPAVGVRRHLYHNLRIILQDSHHRIECSFRLST